MNPTKREIQRAKLERYFLECVSYQLPLNSVQSNARAGARGISDTQPVTANRITRARSADKQQSTTNHIVLPILQVISLIHNKVFNTESHRQWSYMS